LIKAPAHVVPQNLTEYTFPKGYHMSRVLFAFGVLFECASMVLLIAGVDVASLVLYIGGGYCIYISFPRRSPTQKRFANGIMTSAWLIVPGVLFLLLADYLDGAVLVTAGLAALLYSIRLRRRDVNDN
jgi:uncharacterized membrane protein YjjP (DUF1212 family)